MVTALGLCVRMLGCVVVVVVVVIFGGVVG